MFDHDYQNYPELTNTQLEVLRYSSPHKQIEADFEAVVIKVHDGDTITLAASFRDFAFPLRFLDIDAPELNEGGQEAGDWLRAKIEGQEVQIMIDKENRVGKYGRLLGKVMHNGMDVGVEMVQLGLVSVFGAKKAGEVPDSGKYFNMKQWLA